MRSRTNHATPALAKGGHWQKLLTSDYAGEISEHDRRLGVCATSDSQLASPVLMPGSEFFEQ